MYQVHSNAKMPVFRPRVESRKIRRKHERGIREDQGNHGSERYGD